MNIRQLISERTICEKFALAGAAVCATAGAVACTVVAPAEALAAFSAACAFIGTMFGFVMNDPHGNKPSNYKRSPEEKTESLVHGVRGAFYGAAIGLTGAVGLAGVAGAGVGLVAGTVLGYPVQKIVKFIHPAPK